MSNRSTLSFSLKLGALAGTALIIAALFAGNGWIMLAAMGLMAGVGAVVISNRRIADFKTRFAMASGSAWTALLLFSVYLVYMRGVGPVWLHLLNIPITFVVALGAGAVIAGISRPWQSPAAA
jgi:hypothetical protein